MVDIECSVKLSTFSVLFMCVDGDAAPAFVGSYIAFSVT